jgi:hypothetical protein
MNPKRLHFESGRAGGTFHVEDTRTWGRNNFRRFLAWKKDPDGGPEYTQAMGAAIADGLRGLFGGYLPADAVIVTPPPGRARFGTYPAGALAAELRRLTGLDLVDALARTCGRRGRGVRASLKAVHGIALRRAVHGLAVLVDDVITTGRTLEAARAAIGGPSVGIAYVAWYAAESTARPDRIQCPNCGHTFTRKDQP